MIEIKILTDQKDDYFSLPHLPQIIHQMELILGYEIEKTNFYNPEFSGVYLMPNIDSFSLLTLENAKNTFLLGIENARISFILNKYKPIGLIQSGFVSKEKRTIYATKQIVNKYNLESFLKFENGYSMVGFTEFDGEQNALAKTIIKYLSLYKDSI